MICMSAGGWSMLGGTEKAPAARSIIDAVSRICGEKALCGTPLIATGESTCRTNASARAREVRKRKKSTARRSFAGSPF
ncbi:MAG: hypothetical protein BWX86_02754 [Verrucomicrobia bacterium ADurb.Bin122]|nr:MAG: hypothetical protein BWX86_02754 [Verrucomicrobia bacterium ADurb.Bin122]